MIENNNNENLIKEEFLKNMREFEEKWMKILDIKEFQLQKQMTDLKEDSENIFQRSKAILDNYSAHKVNESIINDFATFKNKVNDMLVTHEIRINNNIKDISNFSSKFDKIISDNIFIPGFIGPSCQYKTLSDYINSNIEEMNRMKVEKEVIKKEQKEYKIKIESFIKQMVLLNETSMIQNKEYTNSKQKDYELLLDGKLQPLNDKIFRFYELSSQFQSTVEKDIKLFREHLDKIKDELIENIKEKEENLKKNLDELHKKIVLNIQDIGINKNKIIGMKSDIDEINKSYDKLNTSINEINKEINLLKNNNNNNGIQRNNIIKGRRQSMINFTAFKNNIDLNNLSPRKPNKHKSNIFRNIVNIEEKITNKIKKENNVKKNRTIDNETQKDEDTEENIEEIKTEGNNNEKREKSNLIIKQKLEERNNQITKNEYKSIYNNMLKEKDSNEIFETFYLGKTKIPIITKPLFLDQRILSNEELRQLYKERKQQKKEKEKIEKIRNSFLNLDSNSKTKNTNDNINSINKGKNFNISYYKLSIPKIHFNQKSEDKMYNLNYLEKKKIKTLNNNTKNKNSTSPERTNYLISPKLTSNKMKHLNLINLKLDSSVAINPETNNGAYVLAKNQQEYYNKTRLNLTPTSYVYLYDNSKGTKTSKLVSMTFMREEQKMANSLSNNLENE